MKENSLLGKTKTRAGVYVLTLAAGLVLAGCASTGGTAAGSGKNSGPVVTTLAGNGESGFVDGPGATAQFGRTDGIAVDDAGNVYVADYDNDCIRKITPKGVVSTFAGGTRGYADGTGAAAQFAGPDGVAVDRAGNVYVTDNDNARIRKITPTGVVTTLAGSGEWGYADGPGAKAKFYWPGSVAVDESGSVYVGERGHIRKITPTPQGGVVSTFAGKDSGRVALDSEGNVYAADSDNHRILKITPTPQGGVVTTLAGGGDSGRDKGSYADGTAQEARFNFPKGVAVDSAGNVYVADVGNHRIRKITPTPQGGVVTTLAGSGETWPHKGGYADGSGTEAQFREPWDVAIDHAGNIYVADRGNNRIRKITIPAP